MRCVKTKDRYNNANSRSPRGEIGRHKGLKKHRLEIFYSLTQSHTISNPIKSYTFIEAIFIFIAKYE